MFIRICFEYKVSWEYPMPSNVQMRPEQAEKASMQSKKQRPCEQKRHSECYKYVTNLIHFRQGPFKAATVTCQKQTSDLLEARFQQVTSTLLTGYKQAPSRKACRAVFRAQ